VVEDRVAKSIDEDALRREVVSLMRHFIADYDAVVRSRKPALPYMLDAHRRMWEPDIGMDRCIARTRWSAWEVTTPVGHSICDVVDERTKLDYKSLLRAHNGCRCRLGRVAEMNFGGDEWRWTKKRQTAFWQKSIVTNWRNSAAT
jgi:hypothetical protein